ncbi:MAG TPA: SH3 domain-containing protein, partial [Aggregatilineales bacterium]|nr:SH3 domain-containing protein [Aggregatilineales bacterium]
SVVTDARPFGSWQFNARAGDQITALLSVDENPAVANALDPFLYLLAPDNRQLSADDDGGGALNSRISYTLPFDGLYTLITTGYKQRTTGGYWLFLTLENSTVPGGSGDEVVITTPPSGSTKLGGLEVESYCSAQGFAVTVVNDRRDWACTAKDTGAIVFVLGQADFSAICRTTYGDANAFGVLNGTNEVIAYNWQCYTGGILFRPRPSGLIYIGTLTPRNGAQVNVREGPAIDYRSLGIIDWRQTLPLIGQSGEWYIIDFNGHDGYVSKRWATVNYNS